MSRREVEGLLGLHENLSPQEGIVQLASTTWVGGQRVPVVPDWCLGEEDRKDGAASQDLRRHLRIPEPFLDFRHRAAAGPEELGHRSIRPGFVEGGQARGLRRWVCPERRVWGEP